MYSLKKNMNAIISEKQEKNELYFQKPSPLYFY